MKPLKLVMQAFGSYGKAVAIDFEKPDQNLFLITGDTGAGKTTIFDAIVFALYGEASSGTNKKNGMELQSHFAGIETEPYVMLTFTEQNGIETEYYTIKRVPRHVRPLKRGSGVKEESETISLIMPDGSEYPQKESNKKIEEIVGLTKEQFMQVAMIAQGEFMDLLRAKSDEKKLIFRKLFHTGIYQQIVEELARQKKEKQGEVDRIRTLCQAEAARAEIWEAYEDAEKLKKQKKTVVQAKDFSVTEVENFLTELTKMCEQLEQKKQETQREYEECSKERDKKREETARAEQLLKFYEQFEKAEKELEQLKEAEPEIQEKVKNAQFLEASYEIRSVYQRFADSRLALKKTEQELQMQKEKLPMWKKETEKTKEEAEKAQEEQKAELAAFAQIAEKVKNAKVIFQKMEAAQKDAKQKEEEVRALEKKSKDQRQEKQILEEMVENCQERFGKVKEAEKLFALWEVKKKEADMLEVQWNELQQLAEEQQKQQENVQEAQELYQKIKEAYEKQNRKYEKIRMLFFDLQAGLLAKERLEEGKPCPVCGSLVHPQPCMLKEEHKNLTREMVEQQEKEAAALRAKQEKAAAKAQAESVRLTEKEKSLEQARSVLAQKLQKVCQNETITTDSDMQSCMEQWKKLLMQEGEKLQKEVRESQELQVQIQEIEDKQKKLQNEAEKLAEALAAANAGWERSQGFLENLESSKDYRTAEEAQEVYRKAEEKKKAKEEAYQVLREAYRSAEQKENKGKILIAKYEEELPQQRKEQEERYADYEKMLRSKSLREEVWKNWTVNYRKEQVQIWRAEAEQQERRKSLAQNLMLTAKQAIAEQPRPVLEELEKAKEEAESRQQRIQGLLEEYKEKYRINKNVCQALAPYLEARLKVVQEYEKRNRLYQLLSGNVKNGRMDIETYVQRYYLERILYAANRRFQDMSAGQFELRMYDIEKAGAGKNRGLDLMVYSAVTGKVREVRTLSGGESFMAALALALGMADQIQESSAAINLDIMFIDEGFGSLDDHSRGQAVKVLQEMARGSKLIGIISHVSELKQEIEDQLIVTKDENGSHTRWQIS